MWGVSRVLKRQCLVELYLGLSHTTWTQNIYYRTFCNQQQPVHLEKILQNIKNSKYWSDWFWVCGFRPDFYQGHLAKHAPEGILGLGVWQTQSMPVLHLIIPLAGCPIDRCQNTDTELWISDLTFIGLTGHWYTSTSKCWLWFLHTVLSRIRIMEFLCIFKKVIGIMFIFSYGKQDFLFFIFIFIYLFIPPPPPFWVQND